MTDHLNTNDVVPLDLQLAAAHLDDLAQALQRDVLTPFGRGMHPFTESAAATNPLGTSDGAETYFQALDNCRDAANRDAGSLLSELHTMAQLLRAVRTAYLTNESEVTTQFVNAQYALLHKQPPPAGSPS